MDKDNPHKRIWLRPGNWDGEDCWLWCEDSAPFIDDNPDEAIGPYIYADDLFKIVEKWVDSKNTNGLRLAQSILDLLKREG